MRPAGSPSAAGPPPPSRAQARTGGRRGARPPGLASLPGPAARLPASQAVAGPSFTFLPNPEDPGPSRWPARRRFLAASGLAVVTAVAGALAGRELITRHNVAAARAALRFPRPAVAAPRSRPAVT